jgi:peptidoglycan/xylan/chitin deacetylase (PgdA/CDA1 family)
LEAEMSVPRGIFTISLDFELYWGMRDKKGLDSYREKLLGVRRVVPALLELFQEFGVHATWATVGFLFFESREDLLSSIPAVRPQYHRKVLSPYEHLQTIGANEQEDPFHFAPSLIRQIRKYPGQEIGTHTFSHYYCLESGQDAGSFEADLRSAVQAAGKYSIKLQSLVFPRNQMNEDYKGICQKLGITSFRGNESNWLNAPRKRERETKLRQVLRRLDTYLSLTGHNVHSMDGGSGAPPFNLAASRFLRPWTPRWRALEALKIRRVTTCLDYAARHGGFFHLWWHPHNFSPDLEQNLRTLRPILLSYRELQGRYGLESLNMGEMAARLSTREEMHAQ